MKRRTPRCVRLFKANPKKIISYKGRKYSLGELAILLKEQGSLMKVSRFTQIPYVRLYTIFTNNFGKGVIKIKNEVVCVKGEIKLSYDIEEIIRLFKKYGFLPYVSQETGISTQYLRRILLEEFGMGLIGIKKKLGINKKCLKRRDLNKNIARYNEIKEAYERLGSLQKVGVEFNLTRERIRQILKKGEKQGVFDYVLYREKRFKEISQKYNRDSIINEIKFLIKPLKICEKLNIKSGEFYHLLKYFEIDYSEYRKLAQMGKYSYEYSQIVDSLGRHPTTTEMCKKREWRRVWAAIDRHWGNIGNFRKEFGIEVEKYVSISTYLKYSWEKRKKLKDENKNKLFNFIKERYPVGSRIIMDELGFKTANLSVYIRELETEGLISRVGSGNQIKYVANNQA